MSPKLSPAQLRIIINLTEPIEIAMSDALCAMAMVLNQVAQISGYPEFNLTAVELGRFLDKIPFRYPRFPAWFREPGGATHPIAANGGLEIFPVE